MSEPAREPALANCCVCLTPREAASCVDYFPSDPPSAPSAADAAWRPCGACVECLQLCTAQHKRAALEQLCSETCEASVRRLLARGEPQRLRDATLYADHSAHEPRWLRVGGARVVPAFACPPFSAADSEKFQRYTRLLRAARRPADLTNAAAASETRAPSPPRRTPQ